MTQLLNWYFFFISILYLSLRQFRNLLVKESLDNRFLFLVFNQSRILCLVLWFIGFISFVLSLERKHVKYQLKQFLAVHLILVLSTFPIMLMISLIYKGQIWFVMPHLLIIFNDACAYLFGITLGKTPLIKLSPNKTWEGFLGGIVGTTITAAFCARYFTQYQWFTCPQHHLTFKMFAFDNDCVTDPIFTQEYPLNLNFLAAPLGLLGVEPPALTFTEFHIHVIVLALFASLIGPFGGFFASGLKRALKIKDFANWIPGHGGFTDRCDCSILMNIFVYVYIFQVVYKTTPQQLGIMNLIGGLGMVEQVQIY